MYVLGLWTFVVALGHFASEWVVYRTVRLGKGVAPSGVVALGSVIWMLLQWGNYVV